ncbi:MAG: phosphatase PAP2 family protein [Chitinophagaceae bacterium]|nr:phosphatase PAP2 family protein [Oligoflexus sp.]
MIFKLLSSQVPWLLLLACLFLQSAYRRQWANIRALFWLGATVGISDAVAAQIIKPFAARIRPCIALNWIHVVDGCAGSLSFPSNHASNGAAFAAFWFMWKGGPIGWFALACAFCVGISRVYLGMHYPSDVLGGFVLGSCIGGLSFVLARRFILSESPNTTAIKKEAV